MAERTKNVEHAIAYRRSVSATKHAAVTALLDEYERSGAPVNVSLVARRTGCSTTFLYNHGYDDRINGLAGRAGRLPSPLAPGDGRPASDASLRSRLTAALKEIERLKEEATTAREELNRKDQALALALGQLRAQPTALSSR